MSQSPGPPPLLTCVEHLGEQAAHQAGVEVCVGEEKRQAGVARLTQTQPLLAALVHAVAAQHALKQLGCARAQTRARIRARAHTHTHTHTHAHTVRHGYVKA